MPKKLLLFLIIFIVLIFNYSNNNSFAYDDQTTHPALTDEIVDFYNLSFPDKKLTPQQKEWIVEGSILEDTPPRWINHFYDPINKSGWSGEYAGIYDAETVQLISKNIIAPYGITPVSSLDWLHNGQLQAQYGFYKGNKTWEQGILEMIKGNEKKAYQILGYILHLIEDATVPDHTRNDTHAHELEKYTNDYGSPYEEYAKNYTRHNLDIALKFYQQGLRPINRTTIDDYLISLATYSNNYFFSKDTINNQKYQNPKIIRDDGNFGYGKDENGKEFELVLLDILWNNKKIYLLEKAEPAYYPILNAYFSRLSRQAVLNGAGVIDLFRNEIEFKKEYSPHIITYDFSIFNNFEIPNISVAGEGYKITSTFKSLWAQISSFTSNVFYSAGNLFNTNQTSNGLAVVENSVIEQPEQIIEEQTEEQLIISEQPKVEEGVKSQEIIQKTEEIITEQQTEQIIEDENSQTISGQTEVDNKQSIATTTKVVFKLTGSGSGSGSISYGGSYIAPSVPKTYSKILITEIQLSSTSSVHQEFVELYNPNDTSVDLTDWYVQKKTASGSSFSTFAKSDLFVGKTINAKSFLLIAHSSSSFVYDIAADYGISDNNTLVIKNPNGEIVDKVGLGEANDCDGSCASNPADGQSIQRIFQNNEFIDTDNNASDFEIQTCPSPKVQSASCQEENQTATSTISHIVISEIYPDKTGNNFDFVELYNPNNSSIELGNYSLKIRKESATSTSSLASFSSGNTIAAKSFFLVGLDNYGSSTNASADVLRSSYSLFTSTSSIVYLMDNDAVVDEINYNPANLANSQSLERKAFATSTVDLMIMGEHRFSGNGYDADSADDFILRSSVDPQNSQSLPEPRISPTTPADVSIQYSSSTMSLNLSWQASQDYSGATSTITYKIIDISASSTFSETNTTSTTSTISLSENNFGEIYTFLIQAFDEEGLNSASSTASVSIPNSTSIIAQQTDKSIFEQGTGNGQFYQYLGNGLLGSPQSVTFHAKFDYGWVPLGTVKPYYIQMIFKESDNPDYSSSTAISTNTCYLSGSYGPLNNCPDVQIEKGVAKDYAIPIQQSFTFNPEKYYKVTFMTYQADTAYFYGSADANSYSYGKATKDNGQSTEVDASTVKDLYLKIEATVAIEIPASIIQSISQNFEANYSSSTLELALSWDKPRYFDGTSPALTYKINDISYLVSSSTLVLPEITTSATSTTITLSEVGRKYKFSIQAFNTNGNSTFVAQSKDISISYSLLDQFVIAGQMDYSVSETGTGNGQFYQYLGNNLTSSPQSVIFRAKFQYSESTVKPYYINMAFRESNNSDYSSSTIISSNTCYFTGNYGPLNNCSDIQISSGIAKDYTIPVQQSFNFNPEKYYKVTFTTYQADTVYFYGSADANSYSYGKATKDNGQGTEVDASTVKDLYFAVLSATPLR